MRSNKEIGRADRFRSVGKRSSAGLSGSGPPESPLRPALLRAYRRTRYEVVGVEVRIGRRSKAMDALLASHGARQATFVTAYNPLSRLHPPGWNQRMQCQFAKATRRRPVLTGVGQWRRWSEAHLVILGDWRPARGLARRFRQHGIVIVSQAKPAKLVLVIGQA